MDCVTSTAKDNVNDGTDGFERNEVEGDSRLKPCDPSQRRSSECNALEAKASLVELMIDHKMAGKLRQLELDIKIAKASARCKIFEGDGIEIEDLPKMVECIVNDLTYNVNNVWNSTQTCEAASVPAAPWTTARSADGARSVSQVTATTPTVTFVTTTVPRVSTDVMQPVPATNVRNVSNAKTAEKGLYFDDEVRNPAVLGKQLSTHLERSDELITRMLHTQQHIASALLLPSPQVPVFNGDPQTYTTFIKAFDVRITSHIDNDTDKLYYLDQHLKGEPKELIGGCLFMGPHEGYRHARHLLDKEYGDTYKISTAFVNRLLTWPVISMDDPQAFRRLSIYLTKCLCAMESLSYMSVLNHIPHLQSIVRILPEEIQQEWRENVAELRRNGQDCQFKELVTFIESVAERVNDPVYGIDAMKSTPCGTDVRCEEVRSFCTQTSPQKRCSLCATDRHTTDECAEFASKTLEEKREHLRRNRMCFSCLGVNHISRDCNNKLKCRSCGKPHPTSMHDANFKLVKQ